MNLCDCSRDAARRVNISKSRIFPAGYNDRKGLVRGGDHPTVARVDLVKLLKPAFFENLEKELVRKTAFLFLRRGNPFIDDHSLDPANGFLFRDTGVGDSIQMTFEKLFLLLRTELAIIRKPHVLAARNEIEKVFLQIRSGAGNRVDFVPANHLRE